jgi:alkylated DNA nucleotide flippase Atl1
MLRYTVVKSVAMARKSRLSAVQKRDGARAPEVKRLDQALSPQFPAGAMLIASPLTVAEAVEQVPAGRVITMGGLRAQLAERYGAEYTCPLTTGIFLRIAAEAAVEEGDGGRQTPYWRVVRDDGRLLDKLPGGAAAQAKLLLAEGVGCRAAGARGWRLAPGVLP